jgi:hypothetical protein
MTRYHKHSFLSRFCSQVVVYETIEGVKMMAYHTSIDISVTFTKTGYVEVMSRMK